MVLETDYSSYAMVVFKKAGKITMKLYGRCSSLYFKLLKPILQCHNDTTVEKSTVLIKNIFRLKGRSGEVPDNIVDKFEDRAKTFKLGLDVIFQYPDYGETMHKL